MAAMRSALAMLARRCGSSGCSAASSMGGRGLETHQVLRPAAPSSTLPLPSLRPASTRTPPLQSLRTSATRYFGLRRYSSECTDKDKLLLMNGSSDRLSHMWFQRSRQAVKTVLEADHYLVLLVAFALVLPCGYTMTELWRLKLLPFSGPRTPVPHVDYDDYEDDGESDD